MFPLRQLSQIQANERGFDTIGIGTSIFEGYNIPEVFEDDVQQTYLECVTGMRFDYESITLKEAAYAVRQLDLESSNKPWVPIVPGKKVRR